MAAGDVASRPFGHARSCPTTAVVYYLGRQDHLLSPAATEIRRALKAALGALVRNARRVGELKAGASSAEKGLAGDDVLRRFLL